LYYFLNKNSFQPIALKTPDIPPAAVEEISSTPASIPLAPKCTSLDNLSNCSDLSSLENFDWDSVSLTHSVSENQQKAPAANGHSNNFAFQAETFTDEKTTKYFQKEVESYEKLLENLHVKMLNGKTQLGAKWQELQQKLDKDASANKRSTTIAKLFPEKNRSLDCLPFDHARVKLDKQTDDYINAAYMKVGHHQHTKYIIEDFNALSSNPNSEIQEYSPLKSFNYRQTYYVL